MNDEQFNAEQRKAAELDQFLENYRAAEMKPNLPEADFAVQLHDTVQSIRPDPAFLAKLAARLNAQHEAQFTFTPSSNGHHQEEKMTIFTNPAYPVSQKRREKAFPLVAAVALLMLTLGIITLALYPRYNAFPSASVLMTATPEPALPLPVGGWASEFLQTNDLNDLQTSGMTWLAVGLTYEADLPEFALRRAESWIVYAHDNGFRIMFQVQGNVEEMSSDRWYRQYDLGYAHFVSRLAEQGADAIQIWNEQNLDRNWPSERLDPIDYVDLLRVSYQAIKMANESVMVITGAPAPTGAQEAFPGRVINDDNYYVGMAEAGVAEFADCIGMNYVEGIVAPDQTSGDSRDNYPTRYFVPMTERAYAAFQVSGLPLCMTQVGYLSPEGLDEPLPLVYEWAQASIEEQAEWLAEAVEIAANLPNVDIAMMLIWNVDASIEDNVSQGYAIIRPDGSCPACEAIEQLKR
ncbi:MAG: hypothetical protein H7Y09_06340 [Chitinophagaceae bacterium]|nr:hypothetical protein [Anaerolineae bacterium]